MRLFQKNHGAVTVFLVIILVPVILVTSIFVDVCRVQLAQSVVNSAGDLALNTVLSQYDSDLNEFYGMMASCQSVEEFYDTAGEFYETALQSKGLADNSGAVAQQIKEMLAGKQETVDLLQISWEGDKAYQFEEIPDGNLANPVLVKKEIVEFMKYRSPINGAADLLKKLQKSKKSLEDSEKDSDLIEKKEDYYEAEKNVMETALNAYKELKKYEGMAIDASYVDELKQYVGSLKSTYQEIDGKVIRDLYNTKGLGKFEFHPIYLAPAVPPAQAYSDSKKATAEQVGKCLNAYAKAEHEFAEAVTRLENVLNLLPEYNSSVYDIQYWRHCVGILNQNSNYANYAVKADALCQKYAILKNAIDYMEEGAGDSSCVVANYTKSSSTGTKSVNGHWEVFKKSYEECQKRYLNTGHAYFQVGNRLQKISSDNLGAINGDETDRKISEISSRLKGYKSRIEEAKGYLDEAEKKVRKLKEFRQEYQGAKNNWSASANGSDTELAQKDQEEIKNLSQEKKIMSNITEERIEGLLTRIGNIKALFAQIEKAVKSCKYNGKPVMEIESLASFKNQSGIDGNRITYVKSELDNYVREHSSKVTVDAVDISMNRDNHPAMKDVNTPGLYAWLMEYFKDYENNESKSEENKKKYNEYKEIQNNKNQEADTKGSEGASPNEINSLDSRPSEAAEDIKYKETQSSIEKVAEFTRNLCSDFGGTLSSLGVTLRDDLYSVDYIMSMFSYDTYENEGRYELCDNKDEITPLNCTGKYQAVSEKWASDKVTATYNKSLTNHMVNASNNWSYQNEVEYILYGNGNVQNKAAAYSQIFLLRYALNLPAEFKTHWSGTPLDGVAEGISVATYGIIPASLVKLAIILALTIMETGCDLLYLRAGIPVLLVKGEGDLFIDLSGAKIEEKIKESISDVTDKSKGKDAKGGLTFQYSDYLKLFLFLKLFNEGKSYDVYARTADVIQANMQKCIVNDDQYLLSKSVVYFKLNSNVRVQPLMLELPLMRAEKANQVDAIKGLDWCKINYEAIRGY